MGHKVFRGDREGIETQALEPMLSNIQYITKYRISNPWLLFQRLYWHISSSQIISQLSPPPFLSKPESMVFNSFNYQISCLVLGLETPPKTSAPLQQMLENSPCCTQGRGNNRLGELAPIIDRDEWWLQNWMESSRKLEANSSRKVCKIPGYNLIFLTRVFTSKSY